MKLPSIITAITVCVLGMHTASALTYGEWIAGYPSLTGATAEPTADPDGDGIPNLMEYALDGLDPTVMETTLHPNFPGRVYISLRDEEGDYDTPTPQARSSSAVAAAASEHTLIRWKARAGTTDIRLVPQTNQRNLTDWGWGDSAITQWTDEDGYTWARTNSDMKVWTGRGFMRLFVETK
ncbi:MAG: hypothetical protein ACOVMP_00520 [Chthoniobacterales bacterium]